MKSLQIYLFLFLSVFALGACIQNDIPYPYIKGEITAFEVEGQTGDAEINKNSRTIVVEVGDEVDIEELRITRFVVNEEATYSVDEQYCVSPNKFPSAGFSALADLPAGADTRVDFSKTVPVLLRTYQDYQWMITVKQTIERVVEVENQALPAIIDDKNHTVLVYVSQKQDLSAVKITKMILGGSKATITPDPSTVTNFRRPQEFVVNRFDRYHGKCRCVGYKSHIERGYEARNHSPCGIQEEVGRYLDRCTRNRCETGKWYNFQYDTDRIARWYRLRLAGSGRGSS